MPVLRGPECRPVLSGRAPGEGRTLPDAIRRKAEQVDSSGVTRSCRTEVGQARQPTSSPKRNRQRSVPPETQNNRPRSHRNPKESPNRTTPRTRNPHRRTGRHAKTAMPPPVSPASLPASPVPLPVSPAKAGAHCPPVIRRNPSPPATANWLARMVTRFQRTNHATPRSSPLSMRFSMRVSTP